MIFSISPKDLRNIASHAAVSISSIVVVWFGMIYLIELMNTHPLLYHATNTGMLSGLLHALTGPDHLIALLPFIFHHRWYTSSQYGLVWGIGHGFTSARKEEGGRAQRFHNGVDGGGESHDCERKHERETVSVKNGKNGSSIALLSYSLFKQMNIVVKIV